MVRIVHCFVRSGIVCWRSLMRNWCALCGSRDLHFEEGVTKLQTLKEAGPSLGAAMADNAMTRAALDQAGMTYVKRRLN